MQNNEMNKLFAEGGMMDDSGEVVNGVEVPAGSLASEVADDIPAQLSEGEFVIPADVVRYIGLEKLMKLRDQAKQGLGRMEEMGQMGNADQVNNPDQTFAEEDGEYEDDDFEGNIDSIMAEVGGGEEVNMAAGGYMTGTDLSKAPKNSAVDVRYFKHADGRRIYITYINNRPMTAIPEGFTETDDIVEQKVGKVAEEKEAAKTAAPAVQTSGGNAFDPFGGNAPTSPTSVSSPFGANPNTGLATPTGKTGKGIAAVAGTVLGIPGLTAFGIKGYDAAINAANNNALSSSLGTNGFTTAAIQAAQEAAAEEGAKSSSTPTSMAEAASNAAAAAQKGMTSLDAFIAINQNTFPATQFDPMADTPAAPATQSSAPAPGTEGPPAPTAATVASGQGGDGFSGADAGGDGFGPSTAGGMAKGGLINKRETKPKKPTKGKGLAASKK